MGSFTKLQRKIKKIQIDLKEIWLDIDKLREVFKDSNENYLKAKLNKIKEIVDGR